MQDEETHRRVLTRSARILHISTKQASEKFSTPRKEFCYSAPRTLHLCRRETPHGSLN